MVPKLRSLTRTFFPHKPTFQTLLRGYGLKGGGGGARQSRSSGLHSLCVAAHKMILVTDKARHSVLVILIVISSGGVFFKSWL